MERKGLLLFLFLSFFFPLSFSRGLTPYTPFRPKTKEKETDRRLARRQRKPKGENKVVTRHDQAAQVVVGVVVGVVRGRRDCMKSPGRG